MNIGFLVTARLKSERLPLKILRNVIFLRKKFKKGAGIHVVENNIKKFKDTKRKGFNFIPFLTDIQFFKFAINESKKIIKS